MRDPDDPNELRAGRAFVNAVLIVLAVIVLAGWARQSWPVPEAVLAIDVEVGR